MRQFLEKKKKKRELKQNLNFTVPLEESPPSNQCVSATLPRSNNSPVLNDTTAGIADAAIEVIIERDQANSAHRGDLTQMSGDLLLANGNINLGDKPIV